MMPNLTDAAIKVLRARYLLRDAQGKIIETPKQMFERVALAVASVESTWGDPHRADHRVAQYREKFSTLMESLRFLPNSPTLMNAGKKDGQLSACFVLPIEDHLLSVFETLKNSALIHKTGGGTGFSFGRLRPEGAPISSSGGKAAGPISFIRIFDHATQVVKQGGVRRGANMAILPVHHPDIEAFVELKKSGGVENFNVSVGVTDEFMHALKERSDFKLIDPITGKTVRNLSAVKFWKSLCDAAWASGDPGVVFLDRINEVNPTPLLGEMESTNPCGEQPLLPYESCNLGSINLVPYIIDSDLDWKKLEEDIDLAVRFLDNVIQANEYPLKQIDEITKKNRKIGLGIMGWADALFAWGVAYDSDEALKRAETFIKRFSSVAVRASERLAKERGGFSAFKGSLWEKRGGVVRRNATVTTIAPTGTISLIAGVSSGIEPVFSLAYERMALEGERFIFIHQALVSELKKNKLFSAAHLKRILATGSIQALKGLPKPVKRVFRTAHEIEPQAHVQMQAMFQKYTENAVSKTINLPAKAKPADVSKIYLKAYELGCKGITVFRDKSKRTQVLSRGVRDASALKRFISENTGS